MDKEQILESQTANTSNDLDVESLLEEDGSISSEEERAQSLDTTSDEDLPTLGEVEDKLKKATETHQDTSDLKELDKKDIEVKFDEDGEIIIEDKREEEEKQEKTDKTSSSEEKTSATSENEEILAFSDYIDSLDDKTTIRHKIDGKETEINLKEAIKKTLNDYSGYETVGKRFTEVDKLQKAFQNEKQSLIKDIEEVGKQFEVDNIEGGFEALAKISGSKTPGFLIKEKMISALIPEFQRRLEMSNEELKAEYNQNLNAHYQKQNESEAKRRKEEASREALNRAVSDSREAHNISEEEWNEAFKDLDESLPPGEDLTVSMVTEAVLENKEIDSLIDLSDTLFEEAGVNKEDISDEATLYMVDVMKKHPEFTEKELKAIVAHAIQTPKDDTNTNVEKKVSKDLSEKVSKTNTPSTEPDNNNDSERLLSILEGEED